MVPAARRSKCLGLTSFPAIRVTSGESSAVKRGEDKHQPQGTRLYFEPTHLQSSKTTTSGNATILTASSTSYTTHTWINHFLNFCCHLLFLLAPRELHLPEEDQQYEIDDTHQRTQVARASVHVEVEPNLLNHKTRAAQRHERQTQCCVRIG